MTSVERRLRAIGLQLCTPPRGMPATASATPSTCSVSGIGSVDNNTYTGAVIGLGWMGMLYDLAQRVTEVTQEMIDRGDFAQAELGRRFEQDDTTRPTPELLVHRRFLHHEHPGDSGLPSSYSEALYNRPEVTLSAAADRDSNRLAAFEQRYGPAGYGGPAPRTYTDAAEMLAVERPDVVAIATNTKGRAELTALAVSHGAKFILTE